MTMQARLHGTDTLLHESPPGVPRFGESGCLVDGREINTGDTAEAREMTELKLATVNRH